jgi:hypothetical protein
MSRMSVDKQIDRVIDRQMVAENEIDRLKDLVAELVAKVAEIEAWVAARQHLKRADDLANDPQFQDPQW